MGKASAHNHFTSVSKLVPSLFYGHGSAVLKMYFQLCEQLLIAAGTAWYLTAPAYCFGHRFTTDVCCFLSKAKSKVCFCVSDCRPP